MGPRKIQIKSMGNATSKHITFRRRRGDLVKQARELAQLCDSDVGLLIFSSSGKLFEYASSRSMSAILEIYHNSRNAAGSFAPWSGDDSVASAEDLVRSPDYSASSSEGKNVGPSSNLTRHGRILSHLRRHCNAQGLLDTCSGTIDMETADDFELPSALQGLVQSFDRRHFGAWTEDSLPRYGEPFQYWGHSYVIAPSEIMNAGRGLYTLDDIYVPRDSCTTLMVFCGPEYSWGRWHQLAQFIVSMSTYGICSNGASITDAEHRGTRLGHGERLYIDGRPATHGNIAGLINSSRGQAGSMTNCLFEERAHVQEDFMSRPATHCVMVVATRTIRAGEELLINYSFVRRTPARVMRRMAGDS